MREASLSKLQIQEALLSLAVPQTPSALFLSTEVWMTGTLQRFPCNWGVIAQSLLEGTCSNTPQDYTTAFFSLQLLP